MTRPDEVVRRAASMRQEHFTKMGAAPLHWSHLTDAQKLPWLLKASKPDTSWIDSVLAGAFLKVRCACGETIHTDMPHVEPEPRVGVLWHGNAQGGGHASDVEIGR